MTIGRDHHHHRTPSLPHHRSTGSAPRPLCTVVTSIYPIFSLVTTKGPALQASQAYTFDASEPWQVPTWIFCRMRWARSTCDAVSNDLSQAVKRSGSRAGCQLARTDPSLHEGDAGRRRVERHDGLHVSADLRAHEQARKAWLSGTPQRSSSAQAVRATCISVGFF